MIAVVDAGIGNLRSVEKALMAASTERVEIISDPSRLASADRLVVPGQGAFGDSARALRPDAPLGAAVLAHIESGRPYLGICLGLQLLFDGSEEAPGQAGLSVFGGAVTRLPSDASENGRPCKLPNIGWSEVTAMETGEFATALSAWFYFVHSYAALPNDKNIIAGSTGFGTHAITAAVCEHNVLAVQFHPEKSQAAGLQFLSAFCRWRP